MQSSGNISELEQLRQVAVTSEKCKVFFKVNLKYLNLLGLYLLRSIRKKLLYTHETLSNGFDNEEQLIELKQKLDHLSKSITDDYEYFFFKFKLLLNFLEKLKMKRGNCLHKRRLF